MSHVRFTVRRWMIVIAIAASCIAFSPMRRRTIQYRKESAIQFSRANRLKEVAEHYLADAAQEKQWAADCEGTFEAERAEGSAAFSMVKSRQAEKYATLYTRLGRSYRRAALRPWFIFEPGPEFDPILKPDSSCSGRVN